MLANLVAPSLNFTIKLPHLTGTSTFAFLIFEIAIIVLINT